MLISFLEDDVFRIFEKQILDQESKGHTFEDCEINVLDKTIQEIKNGTNGKLLLLRQIKVIYLEYT